MSKMDDLWLYNQAEQAVALIDSRLRSTPNRQRLNKLHSFLTEQQAQVTSITKQIEAKSALLSSLSARCQELERKFELEVSEFGTMENDEECTAAEMTESRKAMESLMDQINSARKELSNTLTWLDKAISNYKDTYTKAGKAKKEYDTVKVACEKEVADAKAEKDAAMATAAKLREKLDAALLKRYDAIRSNHPQPMAEVKNSQCGGCRMSLPTAIVKKVSSSDSIVECENCGRILYTK